MIETILTEVMMSRKLDLFANTGRMNEDKKIKREMLGINEYTKGEEDCTETMQKAVAKHESITWLCMKEGNDLLGMCNGHLRGF